MGSAERLEDIALGVGDETLMNYKSKKWERVRNLALRNAGYVCEECRRYGKDTYQHLHAHHVNPAKDHPSLAYDIRNIYICCRNHHNKFEDRVTGVLTDEGEKLRKRINRQRNIEVHDEGSDL